MARAFPAMSPNSRDRSAERMRVAGRSKDKEGSQTQQKSGEGRGER